MTDTLTLMDHVEAIRELRARGYVVIAPDELEAVEDEQQASTCGCGASGIVEAQVSVADTRERAPRRVGASYWPMGITAQEYVNRLLA